MSYDYAQIKSDVNNRIHNKIDRVSDIRGAINTGVRKSVKVPLKSMRRMYSVPTRILDSIFDYTAPSDIQGHKVIDLKPISESRSSRFQWKNVNQEVFDRYRSFGQPILCVTNNGLSRILKATVSGNDLKAMISEMDSITDGGSWAAVGTASNLETDTTTFIYGSGSIKFDIGAGIQDGIDVALTSAVYIDSYRSDGSAYVSVSLPSVSGVTGITLRLGSDSSNYLELSATSDISGNAITSGFNTFRLKLSGGIETGTPDYENIDYVAVLVDKETDTLTGVRVDRIIVGAGGQHMLEYYSRFGWQTSAGVWLENSTVDSDVLNAEQEEYDLIVEHCVVECGLAAREYQDAKDAKENLGSHRTGGMIRDYRLNNPDCSIRLMSDDYIIGSAREYGRN